MDLKKKFELKKFIFVLTKTFGDSRRRAFLKLKYLKGERIKREKKKILCLKSSKKWRKKKERSIKCSNLLLTIDSLLKWRVSRVFEDLKNVEILDGKKMTTTTKKRRKISLKLFLGFVTRLAFVIDKRYKKMLFLKLKAKFLRYQAYKKNVTLFKDIIGSLIKQKRTSDKKDFFERLNKYEELEESYMVKSRYVLSVDQDQEKSYQSDFQVEFCFRLVSLEKLIELKKTMRKFNFFNMLKRKCREEELKKIILKKNLRISLERKVSCRVVSRITRGKRMKEMKLFFDLLKQINKKRTMIKLALKNINLIIKAKMILNQSTFIQCLKSHSPSKPDIKEERKKPRLRKSNTKSILHEKFNALVTIPRSKSQSKNLQSKILGRRLSSRYPNAQIPKKKDHRLSFRGENTVSSKQKLATKFIVSEANFFKPSFQNTKTPADISPHTIKPISTCSYDLREKLEKIHFDNLQKMKSSPLESSRKSP